MASTKNLPWHLLADAGDFFDTRVPAPPGTAHSGPLKGIKSAAARRPYDTTVEVLPHPEFTNMRLVRVTRNTSPQ